MNVITFSRPIWALLSPFTDEETGTKRLSNMINTINNQDLSQDLLDNILNDYTCCHPPPILHPLILGYLPKWFKFL